MDIKPKKITITSKVGGESVSQSYMIHRYKGSVATGLVIRGASIVKSALKESPEKFGNEVQDLLNHLCMNYVTAEQPNGEYIKLSTLELIDNYVPDGDIGIKLLREVHDYNTDFCSSGRGSKIFRETIIQAKGQITKTLSQLSQRFGQKDKPRK